MLRGAIIFKGDGGIKKMFLKLIALIAVFLAIYLVWYFWPRYVKLELVAKIQNSNINVNDGKIDFRSELHWWFIDSYPDLDVNGFISHISPIGHLYDLPYMTYPEDIKKWQVNFDELGIDFNENNVILAFSREIKEMKFNREDGFPYRPISTVKTIMSKEFHEQTIYVYKIPKYDVREDLRAYTETSVDK